MTSLDHIHTWVGIWELGDDTERLMCSKCGEQRAISSFTNPRVVPLRGGPMDGELAEVRGFQMSVLFVGDKSVTHTYTWSTDPVDGSYYGRWEEKDGEVGPKHYWVNDAAGDQ